MFGLWAMHITRGDLTRAYELAQLIMAQAQSSRNQVRISLAEFIIGDTFYCMGNLDDSWSHLNAARGLFDSERRLPLSPRYIGFDIEVLRLLHSGWTLWQLGYPHQGLEKAQEAVAVANAISHPPNVYIAWSYVGVLHQFRGDVDAVGTSVDNAIAACEKFGISDWLALTVCLKGWIAAARGQYQDGIARQREFLNTSMIFGTKLFEPYSLCLLAESFMSIGLLDDGFNALKKALDGAEQNEHRYFETEAHRLKGEILL